MMVGAFFSFLGYLPSYCRRYTQSYFSSWVYRLTSVSLYPHFSLVVGICIASSLLYPKLYLLLGIIDAFLFIIPNKAICQTTLLQSYFRFAFIS